MTAFTKQKLGTRYYRIFVNLATANVIASWIKIQQ